MVKVKLVFLMKLSIRNFKPIKITVIIAVSKKTKRGKVCNYYL